MAQLAEKRMMRGAVVGGVHTKTIAILGAIAIGFRLDGEPIKSIGGVRA